MDDALREYLDHRFSTIDRRLDEIDAKIDSHAERMTSVEKDCTYIGERVQIIERAERTSIEVCRAAQKECRDLVDKSIDHKISKATDGIRFWIVAGVCGVLLLVSGYLIATSVIEPVHEMTTKTTRARR